MLVTVFSGFEGFLIRKAQTAVVKTNISGAKITALKVFLLLMLLRSFKMTSATKARKAAISRTMHAAANPKPLGETKIEVGPSAPPIIEMLCNN